MTDTIRTSLEWILQQLIEAEATAVIGAAPHQRTDARTAQRNGHRARLLSPAAGPGSVRQRDRRRRDGTDRAPRWP